MKPTIRYTFAFKISQKFELFTKSYAFNNSLTSQFIIYGQNNFKLK
jgi:hypothetical protein